MKKLSISLAVLASFAISFSAQAQTESSSQSIGMWQINSTADPMTDELSCIAYYGDDERIQLYVDAFAISYRGIGGISSYKLRFDDNPSSGTILARKVERDISAFILRNEKFNEVLESSRLRVQALTILSTLKNDDIDTSDAKAAVEKMKSMGCK